MMIKNAIAFCALMLPTYVAGQSLSSTECADIQQLYNITPPECAGTLPARSSVVSTAVEPVVASDPSGGVTAEMRENHIFFPGGGTALDATAQTQIAQLARILQGNVMGNACLLLIGHSDTSGGAETNRRIALERAAAVRSSLENQLLGVPRVNEIRSMGEDYPIVSLAPTSVWQRRVEIRARACG